MSKITVIIKNVNEEPKIVEVDSGYETISNVVGGTIELFRWSEILEKNMIDIYLNDEGKLIGLHPNIVVIEKSTGNIVDYIMGNLFIVSTNDEGGSVSLTKEQIDIVNEVVFGEELILCMGEKIFICGVIRV